MANESKDRTNPAPQIRRCAAAIGLLFASCLACSPTYPDISGSAELLRAAALDQAKKEDKQVFLLFTAPDCDWCKQFDVYHSDPEVMKVISKHFVLLKIDVRQTPGGDHMFAQYGGTDRLPLFSILDYKGMLLANSGDGDENIGFPTQPGEVEAYFAALKTACPTLNNEEAELLHAKLNDVNAKVARQAN
jgi:hypothetical protein